MRAEALLDAVGGIDERYLAEAEALRPARIGRPRLRVVLIAAALACLFSVTAYAAGWFGLGSRVTAARDLSLSGILDSEEALAYSEWVAYRDAYFEEYRDAHFDTYIETQGEEPFDFSWTQESPELAGAAALYGAVDRSSAEVLLGIAAQHGLGIHSRALRFSSAGNLLRAAGVPPFAGENAVYRGLVYEDGSYEAELTLSLENGPENLSFRRHFSGVLQPTGLERALVTPEAFLEWPYRNARGQELLLALSASDEQLYALGNERVERGDDQRFPFYLLYEQEGQYLTAAGSLRLSSGFDEAARAQLEAIADALDFAAAAATDSDVEHYLNYAPVSVPAEGRPDLAAFLAQPEAQASLILQRQLSGALGLEIGRGMEAVVHGGGDLDLLHSGEPIPGTEIDALLEELAKEYALRWPSEYSAVWGGGLSDFGGEIRYRLDNGVFGGFDADRNAYLYLPRGSFFAASLLYALPEAAAASGWFYENPNGDTVFLCRTESDPRVGYLLYADEGGWFLLLVDGPELWQLEEAADRLQLSKLS